MGIRAAMAILVGSGTGQYATMLPVRAAMSANMLLLRLYAVRARGPAISRRPAREIPAGARQIDMFPMETAAEIAPGCSVPVANAQVGICNAKNSCLQTALVFPLVGMIHACLVAEMVLQGRAWAQVNRFLTAHLAMVALVAADDAGMRTKAMVMVVYPLGLIDIGHW